MIARGRVILLRWLLLVRVKGDGLLMRRDGMLLGL